MKKTLIQITSRHQVYLEGYKTKMSNDFAPFLKQMARRVDKLLTIGEITDFKKDRFETLLKSINNDLSDIYQNHYGVWKEQIVDLAEYEAGFEKRSLNQVVKFDYKVPSRTQLQSAVFSSPLSGITGSDKGKLLESFYKNWTGGTVEAVEGIIRAGYFTGKTTPQIVREIKGTPGLGFKDGQLARGNKDITMLTRTSVQHAANQARSETWKANSDIIAGVQIVATLNDRTTDICRSLDGRIFKIDEGPRPPFHVGCRSTTIAVLDDKFSSLENGATRTARDDVGKVYSVSAKQTYYDWLKDQPPEYQDSVIGPKRGQLLREGGLSPTRFAELNLNNNFQPRTLKEMKELEPLAFEKAGL